MNAELSKMRQMMQELHLGKHGSTHAYGSNPTSFPSSSSFDMADNHAVPFAFHSTSHFRQIVFHTPDRHPSHDIPNMQGLTILIL